MVVEDAAAALTPSSLSGDGLDVNLSLDSGFQVVETAEQGAGDPASSAGSTSSSAPAQTQNSSPDESSISTSNADESSQAKAASDTESTSDADESSQADAASDTEASSGSDNSSTEPSSPVANVTSVDAKQASQTVVSSDEVATKRLTQNLNLPDLSGVKTPKPAEIANFLQQTMQTIRSGGSR